MKNKIAHKFTTEQQDFIDKYVYGEIIFNEKTNSLDITGSVIIENTLEDLIIPMKLGIIRDNFIIDYKKINSFENLPEWIGGTFEIKNCIFNGNDIKITTKYIGGNFLLHDNNNIGNLIELPNYIGGEFYFGDIWKKLKSIPKSIGGDMVVISNSDDLGNTLNPQKLMGIFRKININDLLF